MLSLFYLQPFRNSSLLKAEPKSIHEIGEFGNKHVIPDAAPNLDTVKLLLNAANLNIIILFLAIQKFITVDG